MTARALANRYRPQTFASTVGQATVIATLQHSLAQGRLHQAYLFTGGHGIGKTSLARIFAKCLNCEQGVTATACGQCAACTAIEAGHHVDLIEVDAASRTKVEDTRELLDNVLYAPSQGRYKVYLIDEVHMLSTHSFNALLKTLEEPPTHVMFLLATTDPQKLPATVLSRCLQFHLKRPSTQQIATHLSHVLTQEQLTDQPEAVALIAHAARGSLRDALSLLEQAIAYCQGQLDTDRVRTLLGHSPQAQRQQLLTAWLDADAPTLLQHIADLDADLPDYAHLIEALLTELHRLAYLKAVQTPPPECVGTDADALHQLAARYSTATLHQAYQHLLKQAPLLNAAPDPRLGFEMALLATCHPEAQAVPAAHPKAANVARTPAKATAPKRATPTQPNPSAAPATPRPTMTMPTTPAPTIPVADHKDAAKHLTLATAQPEASADWATLLDACAISGLTKTLAMHCQLIQRAGDCFYLQLRANQAALYQEKQALRLQEALSAHLGRPCQVEISIENSDSNAQKPHTASGETCTPAEAHARRAAVKAEATRQALIDNPNVATLMNTFSATLTDVQHTQKD